MFYEGTAIAAGQGTAVVATGTATEGRRSTAAAGAPTGVTPFRARARAR